MGIYEKFCRLDVDFQALGLCREPRRSDYLCTPKGARVIGWAGVDGIHYCFLKDFGETVFAVSPSNLPGQQVHPVARNFGDFLALLAACHGLDAVEQAWGWSEEDFHRYVESQEANPALEEALEVLSRKLGVEAMAEPWRYLRAVQAGFDVESIPYTKAYLRELAAVQEPEEDWKVCDLGTDEAGFAHAIEKRVRWAGEDWYFPAWYECRSGLVLDGCAAVSHKAVERYMRRWQEAGTEEARRAMEAEDPLEMHAEFSMEYGGVTLRQGHTSCRYWLPGISEEKSARRWVEHYHLDEAQCWALWRVTFPWPGEGQPGLDKAFLTISGEPEEVHLAAFSDLEEGEKITFVHPVSGVEHTLEVLERERGEVEVPGETGIVWPRWCEQVRVRIEPPIPEVRLEDWAESDSARYPDGRVCQQGVGFVMKLPRDGSVVGISSRHFTPRSVVWHVAEEVVRRKSKTVLLFKNE